MRELYQILKDPCQESYQIFSISSIYLNEKFSKGVIQYNKNNFFIYLFHEISRERYYDPTGNDVELTC